MPQDAGQRAELFGEFRVVVDRQGFAKHAFQRGDEFGGRVGEGDVEGWAISSVTERATCSTGLCW